MSIIQKLAQRVIIDTNVCLDLFVFHDPRWALLLQAIHDGRLEALTREDCRREWEIVLHYPQLPLDDLSRPVAAAQFDALIRCLPLADYIPPLFHLPLCKDADDQKFLETAYQTKAAMLITKDKALLKLARQYTRLGVCTILTPQAWLKEYTKSNEVSAALS